MTQGEVAENLREFCSHDVTYEDRLVTVAEGVVLRVVRFTPSEDVGNPTVLFVAGWITQMIAWKFVLKEMTKDFRVVYVETREKISSQVRGAADYSVSAIGKDLVSLIDRLDFASGPYVMFGSSLGATAIVDCYAALKRKPLALVLVGPNAVFRVPKAWLIVVALFYPPFYALIKPAVKWYLKTFRLDVRSDKDQYQKYCRALDAADPWKLKRAVLAVSKYEIWDRLPFLTCPTLLIGASKDVMHEPENLKKIAAGIRNAVTVDLETNKVAHSESVVQEIRAFLSRNWTGRSQESRR
jgi:pimeloyl-ACP methyl ester carboxylesterase